MTISIHGREQTIKHVLTPKAEKKAARWAKHAVQYILGERLKPTYREVKGKEV